MGVGRDGVSLGLASLATGSSRSLGIPSVNALGVIDGHVIYAARDNVLMAVPFDPATGRTTGVPVRLASNVNVGVVGTAKAALSLSGTLAYRGEAHASRIVLTNGRDPDEVVLSEPRAYAYPRFSPNGKRLAVSIEGGTRSDVWLYDLASLNSTRISSGGSANERPEWTPDGERVLYRSDEGIYSSMWWRPADLSVPATLLLAGGVAGIFEGVIAPDGRTIVYQESSNIGIRQLSGNAVPRMVAATAHQEHQARVSPDGKWIAFVTDESGSEQVVVQPFAGTGVRVQVSSNGGSEPLWSRDGSQLFYRGNKKFLAATFATVPTFAVKSRDELFDDRFVSASAPHANYDVSLDGKRFLVLEAVEDAQLFVVHNWAVEVRAQLRARPAAR
jgi:serine/threonine-protein kinase